MTGGMGPDPPLQKVGGGVDLSCHLDMSDGPVIKACHSPHFIPSIHWKKGESASIVVIIFQGLKLIIWNFAFTL